MALSRIFCRNHLREKACGIELQKLLYDPIAEVVVEDEQQEASDETQGTSSTAFRQERRPVQDVSQCTSLSRRGY
jgi:hypothetical protein